ncbi:hypothetical protein BLFGPEAP_01646 [Candidatus Methanoperedenaceae archaeon GB50]|nr:hypothetical protein BLFGPEAP_01646 [Candidatus Methanoperedenaceae archaeon GB50]
MERIKDLSKQWQQMGMACQRLSANLKNYLKTIEKQANPFVLEGIIKEAQKEYHKIKKINETLELSQNFFQQAKGEINRQIEAYRTRLGSILATQLPDIKIEGQLPKLKVGLLTLEFIFRKNEVKVWYGPQYEMLTKVNLTKVDLATVVKDIYAQLEKNGQKGEALGALLWEAYKKSLLQTGKSMGMPVSFRTLFPYLVWLQQKKDFWLHPRRVTFKEYSRVQLSFDLFRTPQRHYQGHEFRLMVASREQTKNKADFLWVPSNWQGEGYCFTAIYFKNKI